jgi:hypothetical protein
MGNSFDFKYLVFGRGLVRFHDSSLSCFIFINIPGSTPIFPAAEGEPTHAIK